MNPSKKPFKTKTTTIGGSILAVIVAIVLSFLNGNKSDNNTGNTPSPTVRQPERSSNDLPKASSSVNTKIGFASRRGMEEHFQKHGAEFGNITLDEYLLQAQTLRDSPLNGNILEAKRADGVVTRFDKKTGSFLATNPDKTIRTFFRPNDGERYFRRQAEREDDK